MVYVITTSVQPSPIMSALAETPARIEPCLLDEAGTVIVDLMAALAGAAEKLGARLHPRSAAGLADLVRVMNCYYSNLIEGHNTTPREIERALGSQLDGNEDRRNLQIEARAHIRVQREIDRQHGAARTGTTRPRAGPRDRAVMKQGGAAP